MFKGDVAEYKAYRPAPLPPSPELEIDSELLSLLSKAYNSLGKLDKLTELIPDVDLFLASYV